MKPNNLVEMLHRSVERFPEKDVFMWKENGVYRRMSYRVFWEKIYQIAAAFVHVAIGANDKVAILSDSKPMCGITDFALASIGAVSVRVYPTLTADQAAYVFENGDVRMAVVEDGKQHQKILEGNVELERIITMYPDEQQHVRDKDLSFRELRSEER